MFSIAIGTAVLLLVIRLLGAELSWYVILSPVIVVYSCTILAVMFPGLTSGE